MAQETNTKASNQSSAANPAASASASNGASNGVSGGTTGAAPHNPFANNPFMSAFNGFDPAGAWGVAQQTWQKMISESFTRAQTWADEYASIEKQMFDRANEAVDTWAKVAHDTIAYSQQLTAQARKLGFEAARKATSFGA
jgi:hypothetical protein